MKRLLLIFMLLCGVGVNAHAQTVSRVIPMTSSSATSASIRLIETGVSYHTFTWFASGTVSAGACRLDGSADNSSFSQIISAQTVTSSGGPTTVTASNANYVRFNCTTPITGSGTVYINYYGYTTSGLAVSGTVTANAGTGTFQDNLSQVGGTATDTNSGVKSAGTLRVVLATDQPALTNKLLVTPDANSAVNVAQVNGVTVLMGNGGTGTGSQRVTISSDNTVLPGVGAGATGAAVPANAVYGGAQGSDTFLTGDIVCKDSIIYDASTNGNTQLVAISGSKNVFICGYEMFSAGTVNVSLVAGTGSACASAASGTPSTGTSGASAALTPAWQFTAQTGKLSAYPTHGWLIAAGTANALCIKTSAGVAVQAQVFYSQR